MNIPNIITIFRLFLIPVFVWFFLRDYVDGRMWAGIIFLVACISDIIDGYIARKYNMVSRIGEALDPLADKLLQMTVVICLFVSHTIGIFLVFLFLIKEALMIIGGTLLMSKISKVIPSKWYGKASTVIFSLVVFIAIVFKHIPKGIVNTMFLSAFAMSFYAFINYYLLFKKYSSNETENSDKT